MNLKSGKTDIWAPENKTVAADRSHLFYSLYPAVMLPSHFSKLSNTLQP